MEQWKLDAVIVKVPANLTVGTKVDVVVGPGGEEPLRAAGAFAVKVKEEGDKGGSAGGTNDPGSGGQGADEGPGAGNDDAASTAPA